MSRCQQLDRLRQRVPTVLPSLLACDFGNLEREIARLEGTDVTAIHLDVMDGQFVPNLTFGMPIVAAVRRLTRLTLDVHLMIAEPQRYLRAFCEAGADVLTIHAEAVEDPRPVLEEIRKQEMAAGLAVNPDTPLAGIEACLDVCDLVLVMSVPAGFGGQEFRLDSLERLRRVRQMAGPEVLLEVDGGVNRRTIRECAEAGAQLFVVGSALFRQPAYAPFVRELTDLARGVPEGAGPPG